jgi:Zn finger protein HypA/HybF involved in hydrogenase expression
MSLGEIFTLVVYGQLMLEEAKLQGLEADLIDQISTSWSGISQDSFRATFEVLAKGTMLEKAKLELTDFPGWRVEVISFDIE